MTLKFPPWTGENNNQTHVDSHHRPLQRQRRPPLPVLLTGPGVFFSLQGPAEDLTLWLCQHWISYSLGHRLSVSHRHAGHLCPRFKQWQIVHLSSILKCVTHAHGHIWALMPCNSVQGSISKRTEQASRGQHCTCTAKDSVMRCRQDTAHRQSAVKSGAKIHTSLNWPIRKRIARRNKEWTKQCKKTKLSSKIRAV